MTMWIEIDDPDERAEEVFTQLLELAALGDDDARGLVVELAAGKLGKGALSSVASVIGKVTTLPGGRKLYHGANDGKFKSHKDIGVAPAAGHGASSNEPTALESAPKVTSHTGVPTKPVMPVSQAETPASVSPSGVPLNEATLDQVAPTKVNKNGMRTLGTEKEGTDWANVSAKKPFWWAQNMSKDHSRYKVVNPSDEKEGHIVKGADGLWRKEGPNKGEGVGHGWPSHKMAFQAMVADGKRRHELAQSKLAGGPDENGDEEWFLDKDTTGAPLTLDDADPLPTTGSSSSGAYKAEGSGYEKWAVTGPDGSLTGDTVVYGEDLKGNPAYSVTGPHGHVHDYPSLDAALDGLEKDIADEEAAKKLSSKKDALTLYKEALEDEDVPAIQEAFKNAMAAGAAISELDEIYTKHHAKKAAPKPEPKPTAAFASTAVPPAPDPDAKKASSNFAETSGMHGLLKATEVPGTDYVSVTDGTGMQAATLHRNEDGLYRNIADTGGSYMALKDAVALEEQRLIDASPAKAKQSKLAVTTKAGATLVPRSSLGTAFNVYGGDLGLKLGEITQAPAGWLGKDGSLHPSMEPAADSYLPKAAPAAPYVSPAGLTLAPAPSLSSESLSSTKVLDSAGGETGLKLNHSKMLGKYVVVGSSTGYDVTGGPHTSEKDALDSITAKPSAPALHPGFKGKSNELSATQVDATTWQVKNGDTLVDEIKDVSPSGGKYMLQSDLDESQDIYFSHPAEAVSWAEHKAGLSDLTVSYGLDSKGRTTMQTGDGLLLATQLSGDMWGFTQGPGEKPFPAVVSGMISRNVDGTWSTTKTADSYPTPKAALIAAHRNVKPTSPSTIGTSLINDADSGTSVVGAEPSFTPTVLSPSSPTVPKAAPAPAVSTPSSDPLALHTGGPLVTPSAPSGPPTPKGKAPADAWEESTGGASYMQPKVKSSKTPGAFNVYESGTDKKLATVKKDWSDGGKYVAPDGTKFITAKALLDHMESSGPASPSAGPAPSASPGTSGPKPKAFSAGPLSGKDDRDSLDASGLPGTSGALSAPPLMPPSGANWNKGASDAVKEALNGAPLSTIADKYGQAGRSKNRAASRVASRLSGFSTDDLIRGNNAEHLRKRVEEARKAAGPNGTVTVRPVSKDSPTRALIVEGFPPGAGTGTSSNVDIESPEGQRLLAGHVSSLMINSWAQTSNDSHKGALALQQAAAAEFGLGRTEEWKMSDSLKQEVADEYAANEAFYRAFLRAQYDITQEDLRARGLTHVRLFRGMRFSSAQEKPDWAKTMFNGLSYTQERVLDPSPSPQLRPMSSFSSAKSTANDFMKNYGSGGDKMLIEAMVPIEHILSTPQSGFGCLDESEFVVLAPEQGDVKVTVRKG